MNALPDILSVSRMLAAVALLACRAFSVPFFCVYLYAGASDALDGLLARRLGRVSERGAKLDSVADLLFAFAALWKLVPAVRWEGWMLLWAAGIALCRAFTLCAGIYKYRALPFLHTWANKAAGALLFLFPLLYRAAGLTVTVWALGLAASLASLEELLITLTAGSLERNRRGWLVPQRRNEAAVRGENAESADRESKKNTGN